MNLTLEQKQIIETRWSNLWESVSHAQQQVLNWIFTMNTGGIAGVLTFVATKGTDGVAVGALLLFSTGLLCLVGYAACMFYAEAASHKDYHKDLLKFYGKDIDWPEFQTIDSKRLTHHRVCEWLAWISGIFGGMGLVCSTWAIL